MAMFAKGRGHGSESAMKVLKYIPRARTPWQPSAFYRKNLTLEDLTKFWNSGRAKLGAGHYNSGYSTIQQHVVDDQNVEMIPKHELEKYMPDISIGPKALVTPVSVMSARAGHRVTHDLLHSYDAHIGAVEKDARVDHDNISPLDPNRQGLHGTALDCRGRIYRWLRRGPFFNEDQFFRRYVTVENATSSEKDVEVPQEATLHKQIIRMCKQGDLKSACEVYRKLTHPPTVHVYRALTAACVPHGQIADAVAIFEDGNARLFFIARDGEVLLNLMNAAIVAKNRSRIMWTLNVARGRYYENHLVRAEVDPFYTYRMAVAAMTFFLENGCGEEARSVYRALQADGMLLYDVYVKLGQQMQQLLLGSVKSSAEGSGGGESEDNTSNNNNNNNKSLPKFNEKALVESCSLQQNALNFGPLIADAVAQLAHLPLSKQLRAELDVPKRSLQWLSQRFPDVDVLFVARLARFKGDTDLMALEEQTVFANRCAQWLEVLSARYDEANGQPLPYLRKSKGSAAMKTVRVAWLPERRKPQRMQPGELGFTFHFSPTTRFVDESFPQVPPGDVSIQSQFLAIQPTQVEVSCSVDFADEKRKKKDAIGSGGGGVLASPCGSKILHPSVFASSAAVMISTEQKPAAGGGASTPNSARNLSTVERAAEPLF
jgi:hypothetical protein